MIKHLPSASAGADARPSASVSKKFRAYLIGRIAEACLIAPELDPAEALDAIDRYISRGTAPDNLSDAPLALRLVFTLLRPEIDRAIVRSVAARERARRRKHTDRQAEEPETAPRSVAAPLSRRERRRREQQARRSAKKRIVPLAESAKSDVFYDKHI